jgi:hypothetical protein
MAEIEHGRPLRAVAGERLAQVRARLSGVRIARSDVALAAIVAIGALFYEWTAHSSVEASGTSYYYMLAGSFLHLQTQLPIAVPAALKKLADPYNPTYNAVFGLHDLIYYKGRLYLAWLPTPVVTLYLPLRLLGIQLTDVSAIPLFSIVALTCAVLTLRRLVRHFMPAARGWMLVAGACALAFGTAIPYMLRRPAMWEVAISCGACFMMAAFYLLCRGALDERAPRIGTLAAASLCAGLAFGARAPLLLGAVVFYGVAVLFWRRGGLDVRTRRRAALALVAPVTLCILLIAAYNYQRFGSPTQFGLKYQLAGIDQQFQKAFDLAYLVPGVYNYALAPPRLALTFPHIFLIPPPQFPGTSFPPVPANYQVEPTGGIIPTAPIVLFAAAAVVLWRRRATAGTAMPLIIATLLLLGAGILVGLALTLWGTTERYEVDFDLILTLAGVLGWIGVRSVTRGARTGRAVTFLGALAIGWGCLTGVATSLTGYENLLDANHPALFATLEDITSPFATLATMLLGHPVLARVQSPTQVDQPVSYMRYGAGDSSTTLGEGPVTLVVDAPGTQELSVSLTVAAGVDDASAKGFRIVVQSPGQQPVTVRAPIGDDLLPIHVGWGLNRIRLAIAGYHPYGLVADLSNIVLVNVNSLPTPLHRRSG